MSKRLLIDIDGTVADWEARFIQLMTEHHPHIELLPHGTRTIVDIEREKKAERRPESSEVLAMPEFYSSLEWYEGAQETIVKLSEAGHDIMFCSMPARMNPSSASEKYTWMKRTFGEEWADRLILTYRKSAVSGEILIDDHEQPQDDRTSWKQVMYTQSYNKHLEGFTRIQNWTDYEALLEAINS